MAVLALAAVGRRDRAPRHAAAFADAGALAALGIAVASLDAHAGGAGWELLLFAAGFGLLAYGAVDAERVAAGLGGAVLAGAVLVAAREEGALAWWPAGAGGGRPGPARGRAATDDPGAAAARRGAPRARRP